MKKDHNDLKKQHESLSTNTDSKFDDSNKKLEKLSSAEQDHIADISTKNSA